MSSSERIVYARIIFITGIVLLTSLSLLFLYEINQENTSSEEVKRSNVVIHALANVVSDLEQREHALRTYLLIRDSTAWKIQHVESLPGDFLKIDSIVVAYRGATTQWDEVRKIYRTYRTRSRTIYAAAITEAYRNSLQLRNQLKLNAQSIDSVRHLIREMQSRESQLVHQHDLRVQSHTVIATLIGVGVSIFSMIVFIIAFYFIDQELKRSRSYASKTEALNRTIGEINKAVEEANNNLQKLNAELENKNFQLEKYATELSSFTHITSHDMQEPLRKIEFFISIVEDREKMNLSDDGKKYLEKIKQSVTRMRKLFLSMLDFSLTNRFESTHSEEVDLNEVLHYSLHSLRSFIQEADAVVKSDSLPRVRGMKYQMIQLFENLINNAVKFRRKGITPEIQITHIVVNGNNGVRGLRSQDRYNRIDFIDNSIGFEPEYSSKIFEIFQRLNVKEDSQGVGIGLAICRKIAENHHGTLVASSKPGVGSIFSLYLPVEE